MAKSRTSRQGNVPILGSVVGQKSSYKTTISGGGRKVSGAGRTSYESQRSASKKWGR